MRVDASERIRAQDEVVRLEGRGTSDHSRRGCWRSRLRTRVDCGKEGPSKDRTTDEVIGDGAAAVVGGGSAVA